MRCDKHDPFYMDSIYTCTICRKELKEAADALAKAAEMLWVVLANVSEGDWKKQQQDWQDAAARWRDEYHQTLAAYEKARNGK